MSHFRKAFEEAKTSRQLFELAKQVPQEQIAIFIKEAAAYARELNEKEGNIRNYTPEMEQRAVKEIICRVAARESPEALKEMETKLGFELQQDPLSALLGMLGGASVLVLTDGDDINPNCPGCPRCQPDRFDPDVITVEGHTVNEEPPSGEGPRLLPLKTR